MSLVVSSSSRALLRGLVGCKQRSEDAADCSPLPGAPLGPFVTLSRS